MDDDDDVVVVVVVGVVNVVEGVMGAFVVLERADAKG